jgi:hypothetical protein
MRSADRASLEFTAGAACRTLAASAHLALTTPALPP